MTIRINQIAVDFTLEKEKTLADLTASLRAWATGQDLAILGILADGKALGPEDATPLEGLHTIEVEAVPAGERDLARVAVLARYFSLLAEGWASTNQELIEELHREYPSVRGALFPLLDGVKDRLTSPLHILDGPWMGSETLAGAAHQVAQEAESRRKELQSPALTLAQTLSALEAQIQTLADLGVLFQRGEDRAAFDLILGLFTLLEDVNRRVELYLKSDGSSTVPWQAFHDALQPFLRETEAALGSGDYILLTDLLEYEVVPRLAGLKTLFPEISNLDPVSELL